MYSRFIHIIDCNRHKLSYILRTFYKVFISRFVMFTACVEVMTGCLNDASLPDKKIYIYKVIKLNCESTMTCFYNFFYIIADILNRRRNFLQLLTNHRIDDISHRDIVVIRLPICGCWQLCCAWALLRLFTSTGIWFFLI